MRVLVVGAGGVGRAIAIAANTSEGLDHIVVADLDENRATRAVDGLDAASLRERRRSTRPIAPRSPSSPAPSAST